MVPRYTRPEMAAIWAPENRFRIWFEIEALAAEGMAAIGTIPDAAARAIRNRGGAKVAHITQADLDRIDAIERETRHDVIAFLTWLAEAIGPDSRFVHQGMTSSDVLDTCLSVQLVQATDLLLRDLDAVLEALKTRAFEHKHTLTIGRSHGIHAEPTTFGLKLAGHHAEFARDRQRLTAARGEIAVAAISGAVGTFAHIDPRVEAFVAERLGLAVEPVSTQVIPRDRHAAWFCTLAVIASGIERLATEVRHLQRSEVREAEEFFHPGQKGSSAMPHKRNPVLSENLTGLARVIRATVIPALENVTLWHERDISHSSVERVIAPDASIALDFALARLAGMIERLTIYPERMTGNLEALGGVVHSGEVLLALTRAGILREDAYRIVQRAAMQTWERLGQPDARSFRENLQADPDVAARVPPAELDRAMDPALHLRELDRIFARVFGKSSPAPLAGGGRGGGVRPRRLCTLVILIRPGHDWPIALAANRDEQQDRPWDSPAAWWPDRPAIVAGRDRSGGGTWLGLNAAGVAAAVLNRPGSLGPAPGKRTRGELPLIALDHASVDAAVTAVTRFDSGDWRSFNMVMADRGGAMFIRGLGRGRPAAQRLMPGLHMITAHDPDDPDSPRVARHLARFRAAMPPDADQWQSWTAILADWAGSPAEQMNVVPRAGFGTICSSLIALPAIGPPIWLFAAGPPDVAPFLPVDLEHSI